jgi:HEAT repeat protein
VLWQLLESADRPARKPAFQCLREIGASDHTVAPKLIELLNHPDAETRSEAASTLGLIGTEEDGARALSRALRDKDSEVRRSAARAIWKTWRTSLPADAVREFSDALKDPDPEVRTVAAFVMVVRMQSTDDAVLQALLRTLCEEEKSEGYRFPQPRQEMRAAAIYAIGTIGPNAKAAIPALTKELKSPLSQIRLNAAQALVKIDPQLDLIVPVLVDFLKDTNALTAQTAADALAAIGPSARSGEMSRRFLYIFGVRAGMRGIASKRCRVPCCTHVQRLLRCLWRRGFVPTAVARLSSHGHETSQAASDCSGCRQRGTQPARRGIL